MEPRELFSKAVKHHADAQFQEARALYRRLLCLQPAHPGVFGLMGTALTQEGAHQSAIRFLNRTLYIDPHHAPTYSNLGVAFKDSREPEKGLLLQKKGLALDPALSEGHRNLALTLNLLRRPQEALSFAQFAVHISPKDHEALSLKGVILGELLLKKGAVDTLKVALSLQPSAAEAYTNLGVALLRTLKTDAALTITERSLILQPKNSESWLNLGTTLQRLERSERALQSFDAAIALNPAQAPAYSGRAFCLQSSRRFRAAADLLERAHRIDPLLSAALGHALYCRSKTLDWGPIHALFNKAKRELASAKSIDSPFAILTRIDDPGIHLLAARSYARKCYSEFGQTQRLTLKSSRDKIRIGYFTSDLQPLHPVYKNLLPLLKAQDRSRFELYCFDSANPGTLAAPELFDAVIPIRSLSDQEVATKAREHEIDIALDLNGYTEGARTDAFAARVAPLQINFLGYPGTMGTTYHDFILADTFVIPEDSESFYSEKVLRLPTFFMPYDLRQPTHAQPKPVQRGDYGLPEEAFVYCSFNEFHKITEETFNAWLEILKGSEQGVFWIATRGDLDIEGLRVMFDRAGVDPGRLIEAHRVDSSEEHHARLALADLMLDTFPYNSHTTACDALSAGLPLLTRAGRSFASRVSGSLLSSAGLDALITTNPSEYVAAGITLSKDRRAYRELRQRVLKAAHQMPSAQAYTNAFERLMEALVKEHRDAARMEPS